MAYRIRYVTEDGRESGIFPCIQSRAEAEYTFHSHITIYRCYQIIILDRLRLFRKSTPVRIFFRPLSRMVTPAELAIELLKGNSGANRQREIQSLTPQEAVGRAVREIEAINRRLHGQINYTSFNEYMAIRETPPDWTNEGS